MGFKNALFVAVAKATYLWFHCNKQCIARYRAVLNPVQLPEAGVQILPKRCDVHKLKKGALYKS